MQLAGVSISIQKMVKGASANSRRKTAIRREESTPPRPEPCAGEVGPPPCGLHQL